MSATEKVRELKDINYCWDENPKLLSSSTPKNIKEKQAIDCLRYYVEQAFLFFDGE